MAVDTMPVATALCHERMSGPAQEVQYSDSGYGSYFGYCFCRFHLRADNGKALDGMDHPCHRCH